MFDNYIVQFEKFPEDNTDDNSVYGYPLLPTSNISSQCGVSTENLDSSMPMSSGTSG